MITPEKENASDEATKDDPDHIYAAENIIAATDASVDPVSGEATFNWRITTYERKRTHYQEFFCQWQPSVYEFISRRDGWNTRLS